MVSYSVLRIQMLHGSVVLDNYLSFEKTSPIIQKYVILDHARFDDCVVLNLIPVDSS